MFNVNTSTDVVAVTGSITVTGNVDGRDVSVDGTALDNLTTTIGLSALTAAEVDQLENINANTISSTQWGYISSSDQALATTSDVTLNSAIIDSTGTEALLVRKNADVGDVFTVDTTNTIVKVGPGSAVANTGILSLYGTDSSTTLGPHLTTTTTVDIYPLIQMLSWSHDNIAINFDGYWDGAHRSSDIGSNYRIRKFVDQFNFDYASGVAAGSTITWVSGFFMNSSGLVQFEGGAIIDITSTEAFLIRKNGDTGDIFSVDTTNSIVHVHSAVGATSTTSGSLQVDGGVGIAENVYIGGDLYIGGSLLGATFTQATFSAANNQAAAANVTGLVFTTKAAKIWLTVIIDATADLYEFFELSILKKGATWALFATGEGDTSGVVFSITSGGQVQYTSTAITGFVSSNFTWKYLEIE
ncbi:hypothetical protein CCP3SC1AL1_1790001 [Gammaproteobacteria bacterium]